MSFPWQRKASRASCGLYWMERVNLKARSKRRISHPSGSAESSKREQAAERVEACGRRAHEGELP